MRIDIVMPQMGESVVEGTILRWVKNAGDRADKGETLLEISTDKVDSEIPSPAGGTIVEILVPAGQKVPVGTVLARLETETVEAVRALSTSPAAALSAPRAAATTAPAPAPLTPDSGNQTASGPAPGHGPVTDPGPPASPDRFYSPLVRSIARAEGIPLAELDSLAGTGLGGRVTKHDLLAYLETRRGPRPATTATTHVPATPAPAAAPITIPVIPAATPGPASAADAGHADQAIEMDSMRRAIADHMVRSKQISPHVASIHEADLARVVECRARWAAEFERREGFKLTFTPFFVEAVAHALGENPRINASIDGNRIVLKRNINVGVAVALENGLVVPVLRSADSLSFVGIARALHDLATRARARKLTPADVADGTFTITNYGAFGTLMGTPIIHQPQLAILGIGAIEKRVVASGSGDAITIRPRAFLTLSYDHRAIDGLLAGRFLAAIVGHLAAFDPGRSLSR